MRIPTHEEARGARDVLARRKLRKALSSSKTGLWAYVDTPYGGGEISAPDLTRPDDPIDVLGRTYEVEDAAACVAAVNFARSAELAGLVAIAEALAPVIRAALAEGNVTPAVTAALAEALDNALTSRLDAGHVPPHVAAALAWAEGKP